MLDLVFTSSNLTTINICDELLVLLDKYHPVLSIHSKLVTMMLLTILTMLLIRTGIMISR